MLWAGFYWLKNAISYTIKLLRVYTPLNLVRFAHNWNVGILE